MKLRFLQTTESDYPGVPFQAGQVITVSSLTGRERGWITAGRAVVVPNTPEAAVLGPTSEQATERRPRARGRR